MKFPDKKYRQSAKININEYPDILINQVAKIVREISPMQIIRDDWPMNEMIYSNRTEVEENILNACGSVNISRWDENNKNDYWLGIVCKIKVAQKSKKE